MRDLRKLNCYRYNVSRFFADLEVELQLVFQSKTDEPLRDFALVIGKRRKHNVKCSLNGNVYMLVQKDEIPVAFDKMELFTDDTSKAEQIDIESYLLSKNYTFSQLDSKSYSRERARKSVSFGRGEINQYGIFNGERYWLDIEVFEASAKLFPNTCKIGENDIIEITHSSFDDTMVNAIRKLTMKKQDWHSNEFKSFFEALANYNGATIKTTNGIISFGDVYSRKFEIIRNFEEGDYNFETIRSGDEDEMENLWKFTFSIMKGESLEYCKHTESKAMLLGLI